MHLHVVRYRGVPYVEVWVASGLADLPHIQTFNLRVKSDMLYH